MTNQDGSIFVIRYKAVDDEQTDETVNAETVQTKTNSDNRVNSPISTNADKEVIDSFLAGTNCLSGVNKVFFSKILIKLFFFNFSREPAGGSTRFVLESMLFSTMK